MALDGTATVQAKAYLASKENELLVSNSDFGRRKYVSVKFGSSVKSSGVPSQNTSHALSGSTDEEGNMSKKGTKQWMHPPEALLRGHIVYSVKFLGHVEVDSPKGTEVVKDAIRKMKFTKQIKKAEGQKPPKVELTISIDGLCILDPKVKAIQHQYPLHRISYCADDKSDKRMFTFIAKEAESNVHHCYVFDSEKCAEEITLTVGQAFDLAYRRFLESSSKDMDMKKQYLLLQKKVQQLTQENLSLKARVALLERLIDPKVVQEQERKQSVPAASPPLNGTSNDQVARQRKTSHPVPLISPPPAIAKMRSNSVEQPVVGRKLENLVMNDFTPQTNGADSTPVPALAPPPPVPARANIPAQPHFPSTPEKSGVDLFGAEPFTPPAAAAIPRKTSTGARPATDPFGMGAFSPSSQELDQQIRNVDKELMDLQSGFSQGLSFGTDDFSLQDLDPLNQK